jgi:hypothetical protein
LQADRKEADYSAMFEKLCPPQRMPMVPGTQKAVTHHDYPGLFEKPDIRDSTPDSLFTDAERLQLMMWRIKNVAGIDIAFESNGTGKFSYWKKRFETLEEYDGLTEAIGYEPNPRGLLFFEALTPAHDPVRQRNLIEDWAMAVNKIFSSKIFSFSTWYGISQPIEDIKDYLGVKIALYFLFVGHLLTWIWIPSLLGIAVTIYQATQVKPSEGKGFTFDSRFSSPFTFAMIFWAIFFLEFWKRKQFHYSILWGTSDYETKATFRKEWLMMYEALEGTDDPNEIDLLKAEVHQGKCCMTHPKHGTCKIFFLCISIR